MIKLKVFEGPDVFFENSYLEGKELIVGRGSRCDIVLSGHPGISRVHFKIIIQDDFSVTIAVVSSTGRLLHKGNSIKEISFSNDTHTISIPPYDFILELPEKEKCEVPVSTPENDKLNSSDTKLQDSSLAVRETEELLALKEFDESEKTKIAATTPLEYFIKVFKGSRFIQELNLEGTSWDFGRDEDCHYTVKSQKISRKHFTVINNRSKFFVKDLGSSNGTFLNEQQLPANQEIELKSSDYIEISNFKFIFEIKDHLFKDKIKNVALIKEFKSDKASDNMNEIASLQKNALAINDEFLKLSKKHHPSVVAKEKRKLNYLRPLLCLAIIAFVLFYFFQNKSEKINVVELASIAEEKRLIQENITAAMDKFGLALYFYNAGEFERCAFEINEFMKYGVSVEKAEGIMDLKNQCDVEKEMLHRARDLKAQEDKKTALGNKINKILAICAPQAKKGMALLKPCIDEAFSLDPSNEKASKLLDIAEAVDFKREEEEKAAKEYSQKVATGQALYKKAENYQRHGDWKRALKAYKKHMNSIYPDPKALKKRARRNIAAINKRVNRVLSLSITDAQKYLLDDDYQEAVLAANKGLNVNRDHVKLLEIKKSALKSLKIILRKYYQESIIHEDFGQIDEAKTLWKKIINKGIKGSDYYKKAKLKLRYYEEGV